MQYFPYGFISKIKTIIMVVFIVSVAVILSSVLFSCSEVPSSRSHEGRVGRFLGAPLTSLGAQHRGSGTFFV